MPRPRPFATLTLAAALALPMLAGGCYSYNTHVHNASNQSVQVSILKGRYQREIGSAVLAPGGSVGWRGATNGPVLAQVTAEGVVHDVSLPRRALTSIDVWGQEVSVTIAGVEQAEVAPADTSTEAPAETPSVNDWEPDDGADADPAMDPAMDQPEMIDLIESDS